LNYVIVGNSAAAVGAIESIRKVDKEGSITVVSNEKEHVYSRPLIAHYLAGEVSDDRMSYRPGDFYEKNGVVTRFGVTATGIDTVAKQLNTDAGVIPYDKLLLTTGSKATVPPIKGKDLEGVSAFQTFEQAKAVKSRIAPGAKAVVIGAGLIGMRAAYGLEEAGVKVTIVELLPRILSRVLDEKGSAMVQNILEKGGMKVYTSRKVEEITGENGQVTGVVLDGGEKLEATIVIIATGVAPDLEIVKGTIIRTNQGILVNSYFQTNDSDIFAAGDVAETYDIPRDKPMVNANWPNAHEQGRFAGLNMAGNMTAYPGSLGMNSVSFFGIPVVSLGLCDPETEKAEGIEIKEKLVPENDIYQKLVFKQNKLKGAIFIGDLAYCGAIKDLIKEQMLVGIIKDTILEEKYQLYSFLRKKRMEKVEGKNIQWPEHYTSQQKFVKHFDEKSWTEREKDKRAWK